MTTSTYIVNCSNGSGQYYEFRTNKVPITIKKPKGVNKRALDYILSKKSEDDFGLFDFVDHANIVSDLEYLVENYESSVYSDYAVFYLGSHYLRNKEYTKAEEFINRLKNKEDFYYFENVNRLLSEANKLRHAALAPPEP